MRTIRYREIAGALRERVARTLAGNLLPSESELSEEFGVSRVTVRRALELLRAEGLVDSRQGFGWYVSVARLPQRLHELDTIESQLAGRGLRAERRIIEYAFEPASERVAALLGTEHVLRVKRINLADGQPFAVVTVWCPAVLGHSLSRRDVEDHPFYELLGITLRGATQTIGADAATPEIARALHVPAGSPVLRCERITTDESGSPVLVSEHVFPGHRTEFVVDIPNAQPSTTPSGLRLVD